MPRIVFEEALRAEVERLVFTSSVAAIGPAKAGGTADEKQPFTAGHLGIAYVNSKHEAEVEALRAAARGLPVVIVNPSFVLGPDGPNGTSMTLVRNFLLGRIPFYVDGGLNIVDVRDVATGHLLADRKGEVGERYILGGRNFTLDRLFADLSRISGVEAPPLRVPSPIAIGGALLASRIGLPLPIAPDEVRSGTLWWTCRNTKAKRELGFGPRPHEETLEDSVRWQSDELGDRIHRKPSAARQILGTAGRAGTGRGEDAGGMSEVVLYRCPNRTNFLCPCGAAERSLRRHGVDHRTERVPYARKRRPEIEELTGQTAGAGARRRRRGDP